MAGTVRIAAGAMVIALLGGGGSLRSQATSSQDSSPSQPTPPTPTTPSSNQQPPAFRTGVNVVRVDAIVSDAKGRPVDNLTAEDFEVSEGGKKQKIDTFKLVSLDGGLLTNQSDPSVAIRSDEDEQVEAARDDVRLFAMFLDDYHVKKSSSLAMRQQLARFVETQLGPSDMIGLMSPLESMAAVRMTRNHDVIARALGAFEGRKYDYRPTNALEEKYAHTASSKQIEDIRNQVSFSAIKALIMHMGALKEGRKALILVSEGYYNGVLPVLPFVGSTPPDDRGRRLMVPNAGETFQTLDLISELQQIWDLANRNNVAIYTVDPRGLALSEFGGDEPQIILADGTPILLNLNQRADARLLNDTMDTLRDLAEASEGRAIVNRNDLAIGMKEVVVDSSAYYLLGYNSTVAVPDGKFHTINVSLKKRRPGVELRHRKGYWALEPDDEAKIATAKAAAAAATISPIVTALAADSPRSRPIRTWIGTEPGDNGGTRITFVWEPVGRLPGDVVRESEKPVHVAVTAGRADGPIYFRGRVPDSAAPTSGVSGASRVVFDAPPGSMQFRLTVEGLDATVIDSEVRNVLVPDFTSAQGFLTTPQVFRVKTPAELQRLKADPRPVPVAAREFSRSERLLVRAAASGPAGDVAVPRARLLNRAGQVMSELPLAAAAAGSGVTRCELELSLANLQPAEYGISLEIGGDAAVPPQLVAFRVTN